LLLSEAKKINEDVPFLQAHPHLSKTENRQTLGVRRFIFSLFNSKLTYYSATAAVSTAAVSAGAAAVSTAAVSTGASASAAGFALLPQDAKEIAAIATNIKTNFFIFFAF
jgi:hypothetical protein